MPGSNPNLDRAMAPARPLASGSLLPVVLTALTLASPALADSPQVHHHPNGAPWNHRVDRGPDAEVPGWFYNLGITGLRVELVDEAPSHLFVRHVFEDTPADGKVRVGDRITGAGGSVFTEGHRNGYGMDVFGAHGPIAAFAAALEAAQTSDGRGRLPLTLLREGRTVEVELRVGRAYGAFAAEFPTDCAKSERIIEELCDYLVEHQRGDGSWGSTTQDTFAPLALMATGKRKYRAAIKRSAEFHAGHTSTEDDSGLVNWKYMAAAIVLSEYSLQTGESWVLPELEEIYAFLCTTQYLDMAQVKSSVRESHPDSWPTDPMEQHGGWGHNPGFEGYGPIAMITAQGALAFAMLKHCGLEVDRARHDAAYAFLERASGANGYVWYEDQAAGDENWADPGRTGAAAAAYFLSPWPESSYATRAALHAACIGAHPQSFPDTHGSPPMGMGYVAMAAAHAPDAYRALMDANRWWFALAQCPDGSYYYQPNRDNAGYGPDARIKMSAVTAFILQAPQQTLHVTGKLLPRD